MVNTILTRFPQWPPLVKLAAWGASILAISAAIQGLARLAGFEFGLLDGSFGKGLLLAVATLTLLYMMALDRRPAADYGLVIDPRWRRQLGAGLSIGVVFYAAYYVVGDWCGVFQLQPPRTSTAQTVSALLAGLQAIPLAVIQQVIFSGYLPSTLRDRHGRFLSVAAPSVLFGLASAATVGTELWSGTGIRLAIGMTLIAALMSTIRMAWGGIALPVGILAGAIMVRRLVRKLGMSAFVPGAAATSWLAPDNDPRQGPLLWVVLAASIGAASLWLGRRGEPARSAASGGVDVSFKRVMPFSNLLALAAPIDLWLVKLWEARGRVGLKYAPRLLFTLVVSTINSLLTLPERMLAPWLLRHAVPDPVFIVGVHRSGTTHLHNLLALDPRFRSPRTYQVFNPHGFLTGLATTAVLGPLLNWRRPMDSVQMNVLSPQEEDFAIAAMSRAAPYWFGCFPKLFASHERFIYPERMTAAERATWRRQLTLFLRKLTFWSRKSPLLKSPYNTARTAELRAMFPGAKFVHLVRHPYAVYRSNMHLAEHGWAVFQLQDPDPVDSFADRFLRNYRDQEAAFERDAAEAPPGSTVDVRFEALEADPIAEVKRIYATLGLEFTAPFARRLEAYVASIAGYQKNRFPSLSPDERRRVDCEVGGLLRRWGYATAAPGEAGEAGERRAA